MEYQSLKKSKNVFLVNKIKRKNITQKAIKGRWAKDEHIAFIKACLKYGCNWKEVN
jgi:hypothetical protein